MAMTRKRTRSSSRPSSRAPLFLERPRFLREPRRERFVPLQTRHLPRRVPVAVRAQVREPQPAAREKPLARVAVSLHRRFVYGAVSVSVRDGQVHAHVSQVRAHLDRTGRALRRPLRGVAPERVRGVHVALRITHQPRERAREVARVAERRRRRRRRFVVVAIFRRFLVGFLPAPPPPRRTT